MNNNLRSCCICGRYMVLNEEKKCEKCEHIKKNSFAIICNNCGESIKIEGRLKHLESTNVGVGFGADRDGFEHLDIRCECGNKVHVGC